MKDHVGLITIIGPPHVGFAVAERFDIEGAMAIVAGDDLGIEGSRTAASGRSVAVLDCAVTKEEEVEAAVEEVFRRFGRLDILVNSADSSLHGPAESQSSSDWQVAAESSLRSVFLCSRAAAVRMRQQQSGSIVNICSIGGLGGWPLYSARNAAHAGIISLGETLACEWARYGIRVNTVAAGMIQTHMVDGDDRKTADVEGLYERRTPIRRMGEPKDIAAAVTFLASHRASFITGATLRVDGGWAAWSGLPTGIRDLPFGSKEASDGTTV